MDTVRGEDQSQISFKGYKHIKLAEQSQQETLEELTD